MSGGELCKNDDASLLNRLPTALQWSCLIVWELKTLSVLKRRTFKAVELLAFFDLGLKICLLKYVVGDFILPLFSALGLVLKNVLRMILGLSFDFLSSGDS